MSIEIQVVENPAEVCRAADRRGRERGGPGPHRRLHTAEGIPAGGHDLTAAVGRSQNLVQ
jgi:hypothetical protein